MFTPVREMTKDEIDAELDRGTWLATMQEPSHGMQKRLEALEKESKRRQKNDEVA